MENPRKFDPWILVGISTVGMAVFASLYYFHPKLLVQTRTVSTTLTNEVVKTVTNEVTKEVEKLVPVPAVTPQEYIAASNFISRLAHADIVKQNQILFAMTNINAIINLDDTIKGFVSEDEAKAKFELTLRRNNVPLDPNSVNKVLLLISGSLNQEKTILNYSVSCRVFERQLIFRGEEVHVGGVTVWENGGVFGSTGANNANEELLKRVEKAAEIFANDFLISNPKP